MWKKQFSKFKNIYFYAKCYSNQSTKVQPIKYTDTINLPKTKFPQRLQAQKLKETEEHIRKTYLNGLYEWQQENLSEPQYVLHDGPPYANGELHMGHAVNKVLKDIVLKNQMVNGQKVHYRAGWDCHGLPIELKALNNKKDQGKDQLTPTQIRARAREFATKTIEKQKAQFKDWGITSNWQDCYTTYNQDYITNQLKLFYKLYHNKQLIYRDLKPVYWSPSSQTALAEAELEYDNNHESPSLYLRSIVVNIPNEIKSKLSENTALYSLIWTTTPWTLPANQAICYNADLTYNICKIGDNKSDNYLVATDLLDSLKTELNCEIESVFAFSGDLLSEATYLHPINHNEELPFLASSHVQTNKGTGLVHTAPAHGPDDFLVYLNHNMSKIKSLVNKKGCYNNDAPEFLRSKHILKDGNKLVLDYVKNNIIKLDKIRHSYPIDWRTKKPVIFRASEQWFINTNMIKDRAIAEIEQVQLHPQNASDNNRNMMKIQLQKRPYWCISRQRSWGVPIPVFYNKKSGVVICDEDIINHLCDILKDTKSMDFWWEYDIEQLIPDTTLKRLSLNPDDIERGKDILDIWFDSGISWFNALEGEKVADLYIEGIDQFTGWFQSSLLTSIGLRDKAPYKGIFVHGFTVDEQGFKMSKSLGNIILPSDITAKYSVDVMRWWIAAHSTQHTSIPVSFSLLSSSAENVQKIRSVLRFLLGVIDQRSKTQDSLNSTDEIFDFSATDLKYLDRYMLHQLQQFHDNTFQLYHSFQYNRVTANIINFVTNNLSGIYLHLIKDRLYCDSDQSYENLQRVLEASFIVLCKTIYPILPFLVEESWSYYDLNPFYQSMKNLNIPKTWQNNESCIALDKALAVRQLLNQLGNNVNTWNLNVLINANTDNIDKLRNLHPTFDNDISDSELCEILQVSSIKLQTSDNAATDLAIQTENNNAKLCPRCRRFSLSAEYATVCKRCEQILQSKKV